MVQKSGQSISDSRCYSCGQAGHFARGPTCPARGKTRSLCKKLGHFKVACRSKRGLNQVLENVDTTETESECVDDDDFAFVVHNGGMSRKDNVDNVDDHDDCAFQLGKQKLENIDIVGGVTMSVLIDSGSSNNVVDRETWEELKKQGIKCQSSKTTNKRLFPYGSENPLQIAGIFKAETTRQRQMGVTTSS